MGTQSVAKNHSSPQSPKADTVQSNVLITSATQKRKRGMRLRPCLTAAVFTGCYRVRNHFALISGADAGLASPTVRKTNRVEIKPSSNPKNLAKIFLGNGVSLDGCTYAALFMLTAFASA